ncbi:transglycosylase SLT domain-containing protein [Stutzerimonas stutzeri]|uniref:lytic transglycosylase domain-containing protein n=1 Tax=Stutzerimonas stutzeri TaxID=316 RepID=UPI001C2E0A34|nr:transglycosylase SLT domain-containing protein [Stutzerimonas stutzeri]
MSIVSLPQHLASLRNRADGPTAARRQQLEVVAEQFEAMFLQQILKQMRKAGDVLGAGNPMRSRELDTMRDFYDEVLADTLAGKRQTGIADMLVQQLGGEAAGAPAPAPTALAGHVGSGLQSGGLHALRGTWQRGVEALDSAWESGKAGFKSLVDSVIRHESSGNIAAVSPKGARGLMQLMPGTARDMAAELGLPFSEARLTTDADYNKRLGSAYLNKMLDRYDGHEALALAAYNAGPGRVDEWLKSHGDPRKGEIGTGAWVQKIPYAETRDYTRKILDDLRAAAPRQAEPRAQLQAVPAVVPSPLNSANDPVALSSGRSVVAGAHLSVAFAQPIRIESKEVVS